MPEDTHETDSAFEKLLLKKNGGEKTINDVCEFLVAMNRDSKARDNHIRRLVDDHLKEYEAHRVNLVHMTKQDFDGLITTFEHKHDARDEIVRGLVTSVNLIEADVSVLKEHCKDLLPEGSFIEDDEIGDIRRAWKVGRWILLGISAPFFVALGNKLGEMLFN